MQQEQVEEQSKVIVQEKSCRELYHIDKWGDGYFDINDEGHLSVTPKANDNSRSIDIYKVIEEIKNKGLNLPCVIRFHDILRAQVKRLNRLFKDTIEEAGFRGQYYGVFPIKVNQMREVVEEILDAGSRYDYGIEAGSKPELMAALAKNNNQHSLTICNGYKDKEYLKLALLGRKLGRKVIVVIEQFSELTQLIELSKEMNVKPIIGLRAKLYTKASGKWADSSGDRAKFGLTSPEIIKAFEMLIEHGMLDSLQLFHFHVGSQIPEIRTLKSCITEAARIYAKLVKMGAPIIYFDVGGGVGVDYDGSKSTKPSSINYQLSDYVADVVYILKDICDLEDVDHPHIVSESGRIVTAHHSCVVTNVFGVIEAGGEHFPLEKCAGEHILVQNLRDLLTDLDQGNYLDIYHDAVQKRGEILSAFNLGILSLYERARSESIYWRLMNWVSHYSQNDPEAPEELLDYNKKLAKQYLCNFSVFQSTADSWAIGQVLPVVPINRLNESPTEITTLADITCDSDGKIDKFINSSTLPLHKINDSEDYYLGLFLTGAYQDIMGDMHNLFGRLNEVHVYHDPDHPSQFYIEETIRGNAAEDVLSTMQYTPILMSSTIKSLVDKQIKRGKLKPREGVELTEFYNHCLKNYTYLN